WPRAALRLDRNRVLARDGTLPVASRSLRRDPNSQRHSAGRDRPAALLRPNLVAERRLQPSARCGRAALGLWSPAGSGFLTCEVSPFVPNMAAHARNSTLGSLAVG